MDSATLEAFVDHARSALEADPDMSTRTTELRVTQPFLEALGWDVHGPDVEAGYRVGDEEIGFALGQSGTNRVFVRTFEPTAPIEREDARDVVDAMRAEGVESAVLLNGWEYWFVATGDGTVDHVDVSLDELPDHLEAVSYFGRDAVAERESARTATYRRAAERLSERREAVAADVAERLTAAAEEDLRSELSVAARRFVDELVDRLADGVEPTSTRRDARETDDADRTDPGGSTSDPIERSSTATDGSSVVQGDPADDHSTAGASSDDGKFVVRFFDGGTSVGAIGAGSQAGALHQTVTYLDQGRDLLRGLSVPWRPEEEGDRVVIARDPSGFDGSAMDDYERLPDGYVLRTAMDEAECRDAIKALAESVGLRVMFQGDWNVD